MQRDAYGNYITPGTGWGETAAMATAGSPVLQASNVSDAGGQRLDGSNFSGQVLGANNYADTSVAQQAPQIDYAAIAAAKKAAEDARRAGQLRGEVTNIVNSIKDIYNQRYGQVDANAGEQVGKLNDRFATESTDLTKQITNETNALGAAHASRGTFDSSYRGNNVDTTTEAGNAQIRDIGTELQDNIAKIASWVSSQKQGFNAQKGGLDTVLSHLAEATDPNELQQVRNSLEGRIADLRAGDADNNTVAQNVSALNTIAPTSSRAVKLKTTLSQIVAGNAAPEQKSLIAEKLISSAGLSPTDEQQLKQAFQNDLTTAGQPKEQPTA